MSSLYDKTRLFRSKDVLNDCQAIWCLGVFGLQIGVVFWIEGRCVRRRAQVLKSQRLFKPFGPQVLECPRPQVVQAVQAVLEDMTSKLAKSNKAVSQQRGEKPARASSGAPD